MKTLRPVVCTVAAVLLLSGCADTRTRSTALSVEASPISTIGWRSIPDFPLPPRTAPVVAWTGEEILVIGGIPGPPCPPNADCVMPEPARDGAAYDPENRSWSALPSAPIGLAAASSVFLGDTLFITVTGPSEHTRLLAYDASASAWSVHDVPDGVRRIPVADGDRLVLVAPSDEGGEADDVIFDVDSGEWSALPADPLGPSYDRMITATPYGLVLTATPLVDSQVSEAPRLVTAARFDERAQEWIRLPDTGQLGSGTTWMQTGDDLVSVQSGGADGGSTGGWGRTYPYGGVLTLPDGAWSPLTGPPEDDLRAWVRENVVSDRFAISGGYVYDHALRTWSPLGRPPAAPTEAGPAVWAGHVLFIIGGVDWTQPGGRISQEAWTYLPQTESDEF